jgi:hypothetical protein
MQRLDFFCEFPLHLLFELVRSACEEHVGEGDVARAAHFDVLPRFYLRFHPKGSVKCVCQQGIIIK